MSKLSLSVAMCTYNGEQFLLEQLYSIANQDRLPDELIICDDGSVDNTLEIINEYGNQAPFPVKVCINKNRLGSSKNFEKAIRCCSGQIIALADQDDVWQPEKVRYIEDFFLDSPNIGAVFTDAILVDERLQPLGCTLWQAINFNRKEQNSVFAGGAFEIQLKHSIATGATMAFRADLKDIILPIPSIGVHDKWIALLTSLTSNISIIQKPLIKYRQHDKQQTGVKRRPLLERIKISQNNKLTGLLDEKANFYIAVYNRLIKTELSPVKTKRLILLQETIEHYHTRAKIQLPSFKFSRFYLALSELLRLRYHRYSNGYASLIKDVFL